MGRQHTYMDREFNRGDYDPGDPGTFERDLVFVAMPFTSTPDCEPPFLAIAQACNSLGLRAVRADDSAGSGFVIREIVDLIERAEFLIFDLTHERPNVYYELGYAHGVGNEADEILIVAKRGTTIHFDIAPARIWFYETVDELRNLAQHNLGRMITRTRE